MNFSLVVDFLARIFFGSALFFGLDFFPVRIFFWPELGRFRSVFAEYGLRNKVTQREISL